MHVNRLKLHGVKMLDQDIPADGGPLPEAARKRLLLVGGNGSGKTTILETIRTLWERFGEWIDQGPQSFELEGPSLALTQTRLVAMELGDFPDAGGSLWIGVGQADAWNELKARHPGARFAGLSWRPHLIADIELPRSDWKAFRHRSMVGSEPRPNIVHFPPDDRRLSVPADGRPRLIDTTAQGWSAVYSSAIDLESILLTVHAMRTADYERILHLTNLALAHRNKRIVGWGRNGRLLVEGVAGQDYSHTVDLLSSGERQFLLMVAYIAGFLRPGGIVLLDEPDLHLHVSLVPQLMQELDQIVRERGGQMIVASHSDPVYDLFSRESEKIDLTPWRGGQA